MRGSPDGLLSSRSLRAGCTPSGSSKILSQENLDADKDRAGCGWRPGVAPPPSCSPKKRGPGHSRPSVYVRSATASDSRSRIRMEALEAYALPSSRLANEAAGTTTRFIQDSPPLLSHTGCELRSDSTSP